MDFLLFSLTSSAAAQQADPMQIFITYGMMAVVLVILYFIMIRPQRKKQKEEEELRNSLEVGDDITTINGVVGRVVSIRDDDETIIIETSSAKTKIRIKKWAVGTIDTPDKQVKSAQNKKAEEEKKSSKKSKKDTDSENEE